MSDLINRQAVIDTLPNTKLNFRILSDINFKNYKREIQEIFDNIVSAQQKAIMGLPSAERTGEWETFSHYQVKCSVCDAIFEQFTDMIGEYQIAHFHFCPNCGAKMKGEQR